MIEDTAELKIWWSEEDSGYIAIYSDTPQLSGIDETPYKAIAQLLVAYRLAYLALRDGREARYDAL